MHECVHTNVGLDKKIKTPEATHELMKLAASSHVLHNRTTESPDPHMVKQLMVPDTSNLGGDIGSADAPQDKVLTQFSPTKVAPSPVSTQLMVLDTLNLGSDIGSADAPHVLEHGTHGSTWNPTIHVPRGAPSSKTWRDCFASHE